MKVCFIDESGDLGMLRDPPQSNDQPVPVIGGLIVDAAKLHALTDEFRAFKFEHGSGSLMF